MSRCKATPEKLLVEFGIYIYNDPQKIQAKKEALIFPILVFP